MEEGDVRPRAGARRNGSKNKVKPGPPPIRPNKLAHELKWLAGSLAVGVPLLGAVLYLLSSQ